MRVVLHAGAEVTGGLLAHVALLARETAAAGHEVCVALSEAAGADPAARRCREAGALVERISVKGKGDWRGMAALRRSVRRLRADVFHAHLSSPIEGIPVLAAARAGGARIVLTTEHAPTHFPLERFYSRAAKRIASRALDAVVAVCASDAAFLRDAFGVPERLLRVIPNGVDPVRPDPDRSAAREARGVGGAAGPVVGFLGALEPKKGVLDLLEAFEQMEAEGRALLLAGEGSLEHEVRRRTEAPGPRVVALGREEDLPGFMASIDLFALPSHQEAMPLALLQAMSAARPIVASRVGGIPEALGEGAAGRLVEPGRPEALARALDDLWRAPVEARRL
ncbi:MAG TPA: glycosyltransferase family 4 protein, partial [Candidatus Polarisedimenticolia bacterium]|nr:glycosyltransferase family 4 protein [Candidatus Polarisedimenticolia bacterium]